MVSESVANRSRRGVRAAVETPRLVATMFGPMFYPDSLQLHPRRRARRARPLRRRFGILDEFTILEVCIYFR